MTKGLSHEKKEEILNKLLTELADSKASIDDVIQVGFNVILHGWMAMDDKEDNIENLIASLEANFRAATARIMLGGETPYS